MGIRPTQSICHYFQHHRKITILLRHITVVGVLGLLILGGIGVFGVFAAPSSISSHTYAASQTNATVSVTFFGYPDNSPPSADIAYPHTSHSQTKHNQAGGTGTFDDPLTMAAIQGSWSIGTRMYLPFIRKYVIYEDECGCNSINSRIDIWMTSDANYGSQVIACEEQWTRLGGVSVEVNPPLGRDVFAGPIFDTTNGSCLQSIPKGNVTSIPTIAPSPSVTPDISQQPIPNGNVTSIPTIAPSPSVTPNISQQPIPKINGTTPRRLPYTGSDPNGPVTMQCFSYGLPFPKHGTIVPLISQNIPC